MKILLSLATILFAGLGGSILGLSTLSFYGRPQDKLQNIAIGFAVGVIVPIPTLPVASTLMRRLPAPSAMIILFDKFGGSPVT